MVDFLRFDEEPHSLMKTKIVNVFSAHDDAYLGRIYWRPGWRRYVMHFDEGCDWSVECMAQCYKYIQELMNDRKKRSLI